MIRIVVLLLVLVFSCNPPEVSPIQEVTLSDTQRERITLFFNEGKKLSSQYQFQEALSWFDSVLVIDSSHALVHFERGLIFRRLGDIEASSSSYERALRYKSDLHDAQYNLANNAFWQNRHRDAVAIYDDLLQKTSAPAFWHNKGRAHMALGEVEEARGAFETSVALDPQYAYGYASLGALAEQEGDYLSMQKHYNTAVLEASDSDEYWFKLGMAHARLNDLEEALAIFDSSLVRNPFHHGAMFNKARLLARTGQPEADRMLEQANRLREEDAEIQRLTRGSTRFPDDAYYQFALGNKYAEREQWNAAEKHYLLALAIEPADIRSMLNLGNVYAVSNQNDQAKVHYERALAIDSTSLDVLTNLAIIAMQERAGRIAEKYWQKILAIDPNHEMALKGLAQVERITQ